MTVDSENGVTISDCENISNELSVLLDVENFSAGRPYNLEVSSPGIDRQLRTEGFRRTIGRDVVLHLTEGIEGRNDQGQGCQMRGQQTHDHDRTQYCGNTSFRYLQWKRRNPVQVIQEGLIMRKKSRNEALKAMDIAASLSAVTKEKSISMDLVLETLKDALTTAARKYLGKPVNVEAKIDREKGTIEVYTRQTVAEVVEDPEKQIHIDEAKEIDSDIEIGDELVQDLDIELFGRMAIQTAKQVIVQRVREAEREKIFADYSERIGELVTGTVQQIEKGNILVNLGRTEALLPYKEQIRKEHYHQGDNIRACIADVKDNPKGPQVIISVPALNFWPGFLSLRYLKYLTKRFVLLRLSAIRPPLKNCSHNK